MSVCAELAANISANYLSTATYDGVSSLVDFLAVTGVLLSICLGGNCTANELPPVPDDYYDPTNAHLSGTWIQQSTTGPRMFGGIGSENGMGGIGMILDPLKVAVDCVYPLDAATDVRDHQGCGPLKNLDHISWFERQSFKMLLHWRKLSRFPRTSWNDIPCSELFVSKELEKEQLNQVLGLIDHNMTWVTVQKYLKQSADSVLGHTVCWDDADPHFPDGEHDFMLAYVGDEPWRPSAWNESTVIIQTIIRNHPMSDGIWNEVVMKNLTSVQEYAQAVLAIFYVSDHYDQPGHYQKQAYAQAKELGGKPVLEFTSQPSNRTAPLFRCPPEQLEADGAVDPPTPRIAKQALLRKRHNRIQVWDLLWGKASVTRFRSEASHQPSKEYRIGNRVEEGVKKMS